MTAREPPDESDWSPATSRPGEIYTVEGRIRATGTFARNFVNRDPRGKAYRRSMALMSLVFLAIAAVVVLAAALIPLLR